MTTLPNPAILRRLGTEALIKALGYADAMRFLHQFESGEGNYTEERAALLPDWSTDRMISEAEKASRNQIQPVPNDPPQPKR